MKSRKANRQLSCFYCRVFLISIAILIIGCSDSHDRFTPDSEISVILVRGAPMVGGANGIIFDNDDKLYVGQAFAQSISKLDPDSGEIIEQLGRAEGVGGGADDLIVDAFGTLFWTDPIQGNVKGRRLGEETFLVAEGFPLANPVTISDEGRLFFAQCFNNGPNGIFEADPTGVMAPSVIRDGDQDCASNGMDWLGGTLYSPRWFEGRVVSIDIDTGELTDITTGWGVPAAVKFNSLGELYAVNQGNGEVVRIDLATGQREVLAVFPEGWLDNLAFDSTDRLFVSSASDGTISEILDNGDIREVSSGGMVMPMGLVRIDNTLYTAEFQTIRGFNINTGKEIYTKRSTFGLGVFKSPTNISAIEDDLVIMSLNSNQLLIWDLDTDSVVTDSSFVLPIDAELFQGDLLITELGAGRVTRAKLPDLLERETVTDGFQYVAGLAVYEDDVYVSDSAQGKVFRIIRDGDVLPEPEVIATDLAVPEGISITPDGSYLLVVEGETSTLTKINMATGERLTIATDLQFQPGGAIQGLITHWFNDVEIDQTGNMYVNSDGGNIIYKFSP